MTRNDWLLLTLLGAIWGASFVFIGVAAPSFGAFPLVAARVLIASAVLIVYGLVTRQQFIAALFRHWKLFFLLGIVNSAIPFTLITTAELELPPAMAAILNAVTPFCSAIVAAVWLGVPFTLRKVAGTLLGLVGVAFVVGLSPVPLTTPVILAILMMLGASMAYGTGANMAKTLFTGVTPLTLAIGQQLTAGIVLLPFAILNPPQGELPLNAVLSVLALAVLSTAVAYLISFNLLARIGATNMTTVTLLVPFFSVLWQTIFLQDPLGIGPIIGLLIIVVSLLLITGSKIPVIETWLMRRRQVGTAAGD
jgi:drug/metabolite transporter (DMT)-like permease